VQSAVLRLHVVRPSVRLSLSPSVTLVDHDHIGWKSWKIITRTISPTFVLRSLKAIHLLPGQHGEIWGRLAVVVGKSGVLEHKSGNVSETRKGRRKDTMEGLEEVTNALSNGTIPDPLRRRLPQD